MKSLVIAFLFVFSLNLIFSCKKTQDPKVNPSVTDSFTVTVNNGYGSGKYKIGDTVDIFSISYSDNQLFDKWSGDISILNALEEWHTWFIMPNRNVAFTGSVKTITPFTINFEQIRGRDRLKPVYSYFPAGHKGFVFLLHGTGGTAQSVVNGFEFRQLIKDLVNDNFGIIVTEAEEATTGIDANGDGKLRWLTFPVDTITNVDYVNIRNITDTFYNRGTTSRAKPRYSVGMSNGGAYSAALSAIYQYKAGISYCAPGSNVIATSSNTPFQFCMAKYDNNENVGPQGNADALSNSNTLISRNICSKYFIKDHAPLYPERFARRGDISIATSTSVFNELKSKGYLNNRNYFMGYSSILVNAFIANSGSFPELLSLTVTQRAFVIEQIDLSVSDHQMYSDYNRATLKFFNTQCL